MLELDSTNVKGLYRRAQAYMNMADVDLAEFDIKKALEIDPDNRYTTKSILYCIQTVIVVSYGAEACSLMM